MGLGVRVQRLGFRIPSLGFRLKLGLWVQGVEGQGIEGFVFRTQGSGLNLQDGSGLTQSLILCQNRTRAPLYSKIKHNEQP